ncbi:hypothetical protein F0U60_27040 [Archangium minus]|uniref:Uncharacterized protein n=1 Tax=Archangium minus TaxID=83450 RepID=A0ABY9WW68_9BACT|nr:hypothetical protein F0U60_27040 [Archangium minus]
MTNPSATSRLPTFFIIVAGSLLLVLLLAFGAHWRLKQRARAAADVVVAETRERTAAAERVVRPSHLDSPVPGTLAEALGPLMPELIALRDSEPTLSEEVDAACVDVRNGVRPVSELPRECREALDRGRPLMQRALRASRAEVGGLPEGLRIFDDPRHPSQRTLLLPFLHILKLAALETRSQTARGEADAALETCLDGLALARDLSYGNALIGAMVSATGHKTLFFPCAEALDQASPSRRQQACLALRRIRSGVAPLSTALRDERAYMPLYLAGATFEQDQFDALPTGAKALALYSSSQDLVSTGMPALLARKLMLQAWPVVHEYIGQALPLMDLPWDQRAPQLAALASTFTSSWNPFLNEYDEGYERFATRVDTQRAQLDLLVALALVKQQRLESGTWPSEPPTLYPEQEVLLPTALKLQPGEGDKLLLYPEDMKPEELSVTATPGAAEG